MMKPLAIDLFCGLSYPELGWGADAFVEKFVAGWAENPNHMRLAVRHKAPSAVALMARAVGDLKYPILSAPLARFSLIKWDPIT